MIFTEQTHTDFWVDCSTCFITHFRAMSPFCIPWKHQKISGFLMFSGDMEGDIGLKWVKYLPKSGYNFFRFPHSGYMKETWNRRDTICNTALRLLFYVPTEIYLYEFQMTIVKYLFFCGFNQIWVLEIKRKTAFWWSFLRRDIGNI